MPRKVWVSTTSFQRRGSPAVQDNIQRAARMIDIAALDRPDIVCLPELFGSLWTPHDRAAEVAEPVPGPTTDVAAGKARQYGTYIICPLYEKRGDAVYNSAVVIDRRGQIVGVYEKRHPVTSSFDFTQFESGVTPGQELKVFDLDFGRIGILLCFDINWPGDWARLKEMGAEVVFWPSGADGGFALQAFAWLHHYYVVSAVISAHGYILDITGEVLLKTGIRASVGGMEIDLEKRYFHTDFNASQVPAIREKYGRDVTIRMYHEEGGMTVQSNRPGLSVQDLMTEFDLELTTDYIARHDRAEAFARAGKAPAPQPPRRVKAKSFTF